MRVKKKIKEKRILTQLTLPSRRRQSKNNYNTIISTLSSIDAKSSSPAHSAL